MANILEHGLRVDPEERATMEILTKKFQILNQLLFFYEYISNSRTEPTGVWIKAIKV